MEVNSVEALGGRSINSGGFNSDDSMIVSGRYSVWEVFIQGRLRQGIQGFRSLIGQVRSVGGWWID